LRLLKENGWIIHCAANELQDVAYADFRFEIEVQRSPYRSANIKAYIKLKKLIEKEQYDIIHCHTAVASILTRLAARKMRGHGTMVMYTAHGFFFYKGAPKRYWILYYPMEYILSYLTDVLITINTEDYVRSTRFSSKRKIYIPGMGVDLVKYSPITLEEELKIQSLEFKKNIRIPKDSFVILSVGELNRNKNHKAVVQALSFLRNFNVYYIICGEGPEKRNIEKIAKKLGVANNVRLLGYSTSVSMIMKVVDVFAMPSMREGLPISLIEAMASGLPVLASKIRGITDLLSNSNNAHLFSFNDINEIANAIKIMVDKRKGNYIMERVTYPTLCDYGLENILKHYKMLYN
jgi:glycosyltransferase EpsD